MTSGSLGLLRRARRGERAAGHLPGDADYPRLPEVTRDYPRVLAQAIGRVMRIGQRRDVTLHRIVAEGPAGQRTVEVHVVERNTSEWVTRQAVIN